jgi:signal transduction histidine kinase
MRSATSWVRRVTASVRVRVALATAGLFAIVLVGASTWFLHAVENRLTDRTRSDTEAAVQSEAQRLLVAGPAALPAGEPGAVSVTRTANAGGVNVVAFRTAGSTPGLDGTANDAFFTSVIGGTEPATLPIDARTAAELGVVGGTGPYLLTTLAVNDQLSIAGASSLAGVHETIDSMRTLLWWIVPALVLLVGGLAWIVVGRALRPVHAVTRQLASMGSESLHERVPVPASTDEVEQLATTMNSMLDRLESATLVSRQLVSDASHELRTPIAVLRAELEVARQHDATDWQAVSAGMLDEVERLQGLVDDLLLLARAGERGMDRSSVDLVDAVAQVASRRRDVPVVLDLDTVPPVDGDRAALTRAVDHLVANAARHASASVHIGVHEHDGAVVVAVEDDGAGIPAADRDRVLERFVRLDEGRARDAGGSGLGLAVVSDVARAHGGRVVIDE